MFAVQIRQCCAEDPIFWVKGFVWTYDPRRQPRSKLPMIPYPFQEQAIKDIVEAVEIGHDILIEKSRDMGASWLCSLSFLWFWMFRELRSSCWCPAWKRMWTTRATRRACFGNSISPSSTNRPV